MTTCDGLQIFDKALPIESLSPWQQVKSMKSVDHYSFTEVFGQLYLKENNHLLESTESPPSSSLSSSLTTSPSFPIDENDIHQEKQQQRRDNVSSMYSESLSTCTEELRFESSDEVDHDLLLNNDSYGNDWENQEERIRTRRYLGSFPPPISCIGRNGKPWVCFESVREDGRFILTEIRVPTQEFLHACRKNGRLKMQFVQCDDEFLDEDEEEDDEEEENVEEDDEGISEIDDGGICEIDDGDTHGTGV